jgi:hypothetical protein
MRIWILALLALTSCIEQPEINEDPLVLEEESATIEMPVVKIATENLSLKITANEHIGFGFEILQGTNPLIIQPHIPAIPGIKGFETKEQAAIIGNYMIYKINNGIMPPSISVQDLDSLNINY